MMSSPAGGCLALRLGFLLSAALLLLGLQLGLLSSWEGGGAQPAAPERKSRFPPDGRRADDGAHGKAPSRRQVTYVRSGGGTRRGGSAAAAAEESACCLQGARPPRSIRRKPIRWHIDLQPWASPTPSLRNEAFRFLKYISTVQI